MSTPDRTSGSIIDSDMVIYPSSDGLPMADNTLQFQWIVTIKEGLQTLFRDLEDVFVAGDLLWYPVQGDPTIRRAPDAMVVFGRSQYHRPSYVQHRENGIGPQVTFEVRSPNNSDQEMALKRDFYETYGVQEYYLYDPDHGTLHGWIRHNDALQAIPTIRSWVSPLLGVTFDLDGDDLVLNAPNGRALVSYQELDEERIREQRRADRERQRAEQSDARAEQEYQRAEQEYLRAEQECQRANREAQRVQEQAQQVELERQRAEEQAQRAERARQQAELERQRAEQERQRAEVLAERLRQLGIDSDSLGGGPE